jgi:2-phospho-L-lactate guanylyltransferase
MNSSLSSKTPAPRPRTWALIPVKGAGQAKSRLTALSAAQRQELVQHLLADQLTLLTALRASGQLQGVAVVLGEAPAARRLAEQQGILVLEEDGPSEAPALADSAGPSEASCPTPDPANAPRHTRELRLNAALAGAARFLEARGAERLLVLPMDLPLLRRSDLEEVLDAHPHRAADDTGAVVVVPDRHGEGTNALLLEPPTAIPFAFGPGSAALHEQQARHRGACVVLHSQRLGMDLDDEADLAAVLVAGGREPASALRFLHGLDLPGTVTGLGCASEPEPLEAGGCR